jgi:hypothetical protein
MWDMEKEKAKAFGISPEMLRGDPFGFNASTHARQRQGVWAGHMGFDPAEPGGHWHNWRCTGRSIGSMAVRKVVRQGGQAAYTTWTEVPVYVDAACHEERLTVVGRSGGWEVLAAAKEDPRDTLKQHRTAWFRPGSKWEDRL